MNLINMKTGAYPFYVEIVVLVLCCFTNRHHVFSMRIKHYIKLVSHWDATVGDKGLRYKRDFLQFFTLRSHWICDRDIYSIILMTLARQS